MDNFLEQGLCDVADEKAKETKNTIEEKPKEESSTGFETPYIIYRNDFDTTLRTGSLFDNPGDTVPYQVYPKIFKDDRGGFSESLTRKVQEWMVPDCYCYAEIIPSTVQINRSYSKPGVMRGFHAQKAPYTQGKLVECLSRTPIWDIIIDARPDSKTYQHYSLFKLECETMTKVWVPRGFLHGFIVPKYGTHKEDDGRISIYEYTDEAQFQYFVDNGYSPESEVVVNPEILLQIILKEYADVFQKDQVKNHELYGLLKTVADGLTYSEKDQINYDFKNFLDDREEETKKGILWYNK